jgi:lipopolysaccharide export system ATP-binding protein
MHSLQTKGLKKSYNGREVVSNISLDIKSGEIVGLLGPNGAGKTTTFYMILGLIKPDAGTIFLDEENLNNSPFYKRAQMGIGYLPQEPSIFRKLSVEDNIRAVLEITSPRKKGNQRRVEDILEEFKLSHLAKKQGYQLSGGERRKVEIARAIAVDPIFILLDEPFSGIDPISVMELKKTIEQLRQKGIGLIITDHNVRETLSITDRAYIINNGQIFAHGVPLELVSDPRVRKTYLGEDFTL